MSQNIPKAFFSGTRSSFALIDPSTERYHRVLDRHGAFRSGLKMHVVISYVWSEWKDDPSDKLPDWTQLRERLLAVVGPRTPPALRRQTWNASCCWLDSKCINQDSEVDKMYWIPRMDEVYHEAECTVLLLRGFNLTVLMEVAQEMRCEFEGKVPFAERMLAPHSCVLTQSCTILPALTEERENDCLRVLRSFASGIWRRRAWIFQEILLSRNYLVSWSQSGWTSLANIGVIASILFRRQPKETWLDEFASWCRRLEYLRQYYSNHQFSDLSDANVLQMSSELEATVPCDKYYALCGVLRLKRVQYNSTHTADRALHAIIDALTQCGRLSWLYAIPPSVQGTGIRLMSNKMAPFVLTRLDGGKLMAKPRSISISKCIRGFDATQLGVVTYVQPLHRVLREVKDLLEKKKFNFDDILNHSSPSEVESLKYIPWLLRRTALEIVAPLLLEPAFGNICTVLSIPATLKTSIKMWIFIILLSFRDLEEYFRENLTAEHEPTTVSVVTSSAFSIRTHLERMQESFALVIWEEVDEEECRTSPLRRIAGLGFPEVQRGSKIYSLEADKNLLLAANPNRDNQEAGCAAFQGMIFQLELGEVIGPVPSSLFGGSWRPSRSGRRTHLTFELRDLEEDS
ncbi:hypothetical protein M430DRAFT_19457 [Amorphotheca resinae ATCC 22711]|jgi:hypothetical protein|uniref:Heterokaryon incompatibility domain-containing protein n=1 Tax=Amorphotheca resinae ATCC 22711 TaxID=857342 RepID=A0A2T3B2T4_AMORE|nr:hypothetical protein M430DRAFT_19457 [Amorphotheca resinae ATCC 22711]PSS18868.1 hypothetical protein M430DRAFT_19457 [Amorphotheca resinae ATCC 22711]